MRLNKTIILKLDSANLQEKKESQDQIKDILTVKNAIKIPR